MSILFLTAISVLAIGIAIGVSCMLFDAGYEAFTGKSVYSNRFEKRFRVVNFAGLCIAYFGLVIFGFFVGSMILESIFR